VPLACVEDRFSGTNSSPLQAASLVPGTYGLAFCVTRDDWFAIDIPAGRSLVAEAAFTLPDPDLDLELYRVLPNDELRRVTADVGVASNAALVHAAPAGEGGRHLLHVFQQLPAEVEPIPMYYALRLTITAAPACRRDADCDAESLCDLVQHLCEPRFCGRNFECGPLEECDPESGRCTSRGCPPDALAGVNGSIDTAASVVIGQEVAGTICDRESDWYRVDVPAGQCVHAAVRFRVPPEAPDSDIDVALHGPRDGDPRALLLEAANPARDDEDVYWSTTEAVTLYLNVFKALQNAYRLTVTLTEGACSLPCSAEDDPCIRYGLRCDEELRRCVPFGG